MAHFMEHPVYSLPASYAMTPLSLISLSFAALAIFFPRMKQIDLGDINTTLRLSYALEMLQNFLHYLFVYDVISHTLSSRSQHQTVP